MAKEKQETVFVTDDKALRDGATIAEADREILQSVQTGEGLSYDRECGAAPGDG